MKVFIKVEHYPPSGNACVTVMAAIWEKRFPILINRPEKETERNIRKIIRQMRSLDLGAEITCWAVHKLDQMRAHQREFDAEVKKRKQENDDY